MNNRQEQNLKEKVTKLEKELVQKNLELKIEAALEKVRSRTMAMQKSDELKEAIQLIYAQLLQLNFTIDVANFTVNYAENNDFNLWLAVADELYPAKIHIPYFDHPIFNYFAEAKEKGIGFYAFKCTFEEKNDFFDHFFKYSPHVDEAKKKAVYSSPGYAQSTVLLKTISLAIINYSAHPYSAAENALLMRFGAVFEQTYVRFLDLQKAEAQAQEAKIEAALERVRTKTMAMHNSQDVADTVAAMFDELVKLGIEKTARCGIGIIDGTKHIELWTAFTKPDGQVTLIIGNLDMTIHPLLSELYTSWKNNESYSAYEMAGDDLIAYYRAITDAPDYPVQFDLASLPVKQFHYDFFFPEGTIFAFSPEPLTPEAIQIFKRFTAVFGLTYRRYLDLQKAEAQAREAKIEVALERVRSRTMAMQKSDELAEVSELLFLQLRELGNSPGQVTICMVNELEEVFEMWVTTMKSPQFPTFKVTIHEPVVMSKVYQAWKGQKKSITVDLTGEELLKYTDFRDFVGGTKLKDDIADGRRVVQAALFSKGAITLAGSEPQPPETIQLLERFAVVFDGTYTRFLDLKQAEAQAREAQIQLGLERVRARAMAMQNTHELADLIGKVYEELTKLDFMLTRASIWIFDPVDLSAWVWMAHTEAETKPESFYIKHNHQSTYLSRLQAWKQQSPKWEYDLNGDEKLAWDQFLFNETGMSRLPDIVKAGMQMPERVILYCSFSNFGGLQITGLEPLADEQLDILYRFGKVFDLTYTRFNDLKQAEDQAREAQIQLGLERVRAKAMAMQSSQELNELIGTVFDELTKLDFVLTRCLIMIFDPETLASRWWMANSETPAEPMNYLVQNHDNPAYFAYLNAWQERALSWQYELKGKVKRDWDDFLFTETELARLPQVVIDGMKAPETVLLAASFNNFGCLTLVSLEPLSHEHSDIMLRFAKVFDMSYTRFNDLKTAEAQTREAKIEAALEKVRGKAMAMYNSKDLSSAASLVFTELRKLGIDPIRCGVGIVSKDSSKVQLYSATTSAEGDSLALVGWVELQGHPVLENILQSIVKNKDYFPVLKGEDLKLYYDNLLSGLSLPSVPDWQTGKEQFGHFFPFQDGCLYAWSEKPYAEAEIKILKRFASVIDLTFRRYIELQKSEASAREAMRQASLDRVRAEIASMRSTSDLQSITPVIWKELIALGVPFVRCGVFIVDEQQEVINSYLSTPDGTAIAAFPLAFDADGIAKTVLKSWQKKQMATVHWNEDEFNRLSVQLVQQGAVASKEKYLTAEPPTSLDLHFFPFLQGMLYVGNTTPLNDDEISLVQSLADAFSTAYARYEDFNKLESAKKEVEQTLKGLKAAQTQLIQSEKMASLGELTAGIAHEIQNPLNFVNNFSEVNTEMLEELKAESEKPKAERDEQLEISLINDLIENEQKINHHGKRADAIVKGMLQHSRAGGSTREPTDINKLADEYLRLAYHGLRAKDKSFNAELVTNFDEKLPMVNVVPQDIGRVLVNLFTNAFYAVNQKQQTAGKDYKPEVSVTTTTENGQVVIKVKDNGNGIPESIKDKIMQPFFTTKPTGEGTGLGLSLSYDIVVKGHGGSITVESIENQGSKFIIKLPV